MFTFGVCLVEFVRSEAWFRYLTWPTDSKLYGPLYVEAADWLDMMELG